MVMMASCAAASWGLGTGTGMRTTSAPQALNLITEGPQYLEWGLGCSGLNLGASKEKQSDRCNLLKKNSYATVMIRNPQNSIGNY